jgi:hypothetical protein
MLKIIHRLLLRVVLLAVLAVQAPATVRADPPDQSDFQAVKLQDFNKDRGIANLGQQTLSSCCC